MPTVMKGIWTRVETKEIRMQSTHTDRWLLEGKISALETSNIESIDNYYFHIPPEFPSLQLQWLTYQDYSTPRQAEPLPSGRFSH